jgi:hypothetical protein
MIVLDKSDLTPLDLPGEHARLGVMVGRNRRAALFIGRLLTFLSSVYILDPVVNDKSELCALSTIVCHSKELDTLPLLSGACHA